MAKGTDWIAWHARYDDPTNPLVARRVAVSAAIRSLLDAAAPGPIRLLSLCGGDARDLVDALAGHARLVDVRAVVVELSTELAGRARENVRALGLNDHLEIRAADACSPPVFADVLPVDLLLLVGLFGNISDEDVARLIHSVPLMCRTNAAVIWTRHRRAPDLTPTIRRWFDNIGAASERFVSPGAESWSVGLERCSSVPVPSIGQLPTTLFTFTC